MAIIADYLAYLKDYVVDLGLLVIICVSIVMYWKKPAVRIILDCIAFVSASFIAKAYCWRLASGIMRNTKILSVPDRKEKVVLISVVVIFIVASILLTVIFHLVEKIFKLPDAKAPSKLMVIALGLVIGFVIAGEAVLIIKMFEMTGYKTLIELAESSRIMKIFCTILGIYYPHINQLLIGEIII